MAQQTAECIQQFATSRNERFMRVKNLVVADPRDDFTSLNPSISQVYGSIHSLNQPRQNLEYFHGQRYS